MTYSLSENTFEKANTHISFPFADNCIQVKSLSDSRSHKTFRKKDYLYCASDLFEGLYTLKSGSAKAVIYSAEGEEYVANFFLPGDIIGLDGFSQSQYKQSVVFLETSSVVLYKESEIHHLLQNSAFFRNDLLQQMSKAIVLEEERQLSRREQSSKQRVVEFLLNYSKRLKDCGLRYESFTLNMSRTDIASHTGMVIETVSRILKQLQQQELISLEHRDIDIIDETGLHEVLGRANNLVYET
jgi:CRP/FNR family transcriptional regulator